MSSPSVRTAEQPIRIRRNARPGKARRAFRAPVIQAVFGFMTDGKVATPIGTADSVVSYYETASRLNAAWLESTVCGTHANLESLERDMTADASLARWLSGQAQIAVRTARTKWDLELDFRPEA